MKSRDVLWIRLPRVAGNSQTRNFRISRCRIDVFLRPFDPRFNQVVGVSGIRRCCHVALRLRQNSRFRGAARPRPGTGIAACGSHFLGHRSINLETARKTGISYSESWATIAWRRAAIAYSSPGRMLPQPDMVALHEPNSRNIGTVSDRESHRGVIDRPALRRQCGLEPLP